MGIGALGKREMQERHKRENLFYWLDAVPLAQLCALGKKR